MAAASQVRFGMEAAGVSPIIYIIVRGKIQYSSGTYMQEWMVGLYGHTGFAIGKSLTFRRFPQLLSAWKVEVQDINRKLARKEPINKIGKTQIILQGKMKFRKIVC